MKLLAFTVGGYGVTPPPGIQTGGYGTGLSILRNAITIIFYFSFLISLGFIVYAGIRWITSKGDKEELNTAKNAFTYAITGVFITILSFTIIKILSIFFGTDLLNIGF